MHPTEFNISLHPVAGDAQPPQYRGAVRMPDGSIQPIGPATLAACFEQIALAHKWGLDWLDAKRLAEQFRVDQHVEREKQAETARAKRRDIDRGPGG